MNIYLELTRRFNDGRLRAIIAGGQAVVLHRLAIMSKDGDWILREDAQDISLVLSVLGQYGARYRFGAPLDVRWLSGGWSAHLEFNWQGIRVRTDFFTRPPRLAAPSLQRLWTNSASRGEHFVDAATLVELKKTNREKDYAVIGELARLMTTPEEKLLCSRSARDIIALAAEHPDATAALSAQRPLLNLVSRGRDAIETALDAERRSLMRANEARLTLYEAAAENWSREWPAVADQISGLSLADSHRVMVAGAEASLPKAVPGGLP